MTDVQSRLEPDSIVDILLSWLKNRLDDTAYAWIKSTSDTIADRAEDWEFFTSFSAVPRHTGKETLNLDDSELKEADTLRPGWMPGRWSYDEAGRTALLLSAAPLGKEAFLEKLEKLFISSDMSEAVALYQSLPVLPWPEELKARAAEGIRSNMTNVFNVIAHFNPYPADYLDDSAWNQLILKALFVQSPLWPIQGIDSRTNAELARMLIEFAHERWAAGRTFSPELWRPVGPFIRNEWLSDLERALESGNPLQNQAAALALASSDLKEASELLERYSTLANEVSKGAVTWDFIGKEINSLN